MSGERVGVHPPIINSSVGNRLQFLYHLVQRYQFHGFLRLEIAFKILQEDDVEFGECNVFHLVLVLLETPDGVLHLYKFL